MTSDVMAEVTVENHTRDMSIRALVLVVFVPFLLFSLWVGATDGPLGFLALAAREPWGLQLLLDLAISLGFVTTWMVLDARRRRVTVWPFVIATILLGSFGPMAYVLARRSDRLGAG
jgi:hypothetical protein